MLRRTYITLLFPLIASPFIANASTEMGVQALRAGDVRTAYANLQPAAIAGDAIAQFSMCGMYFMGQGVPKNAYEAFNWCKLAAEQGHLEAMYNLALFYQKGSGVGQNYNEAIRWYQMAAERGHKDAQFNLLQLYNANAQAKQPVAAQGILPPAPKQPPKQAVAQAAPPGAQAPQAAPQQVAPVAAAPQMAPQAVAQAAPQPAPQAAPQAMPVEQVQQTSLPDTQPAPPPMTAQERQAYDFQQACLEAAQRGIFADNCAGRTAQAAAKPTVKAIETKEAVDTRNTIGWFEKQAELGDLAAQNNLGVMYRRGMGVTKDSAKAFSLFEKSAARGSVNGMLNLANMYKLGEGTEQNLELSYAWYNLAADRLNAGDMKKTALTNIKEISGHMSNEQIGSAMEYVTKLDNTIPMEQQK